MSKHTPGPWRRRGDDSVETADGREWIANVCDGPGALADARLIAAAPELLEALKTAVVALRGEYDRVGALQRARAAIAKAEGRHE